MILSQNLCKNTIVLVQIIHYCQNSQYDNKETAQCYQKFSEIYMAASCLLASISYRPTDLSLLKEFSKNVSFSNTVFPHIVSAETILFW